MKWFRGAFFADPAIILATAFFGLISIFVFFFDKVGNTILQVARMWARTLLAVSGVRVRVEGVEWIDAGASYVFISNHASYMDTPVVLSHVPVQFRFLAKRGLFQIPFLGTHLSQAGHIPVPREDPRAAVKVLHLAAETITAKRISLLVFPEGGRSHDGVLQEFKEGGAFIAIKAQVPVVPLVLIGTRAVLPYGGGIVRSGNVTLRILPPISTKGMALRDRGALTGRVREMIQREL
jgi:1-acyl-sn-glycerol-3-phosphate acyltransferase